MRNIQMIFDFELLSIIIYFESQILALFDSTPLILGNNLFNLITPVWKLHNPYCHNVVL